MPKKKKTNWSLESTTQEIKKFLPDLDLQTKLTLYIIINLGLAALTWLSLLGLAGSFGSLSATILYLLVGRMAILIPIINVYIAIILFKVQKNLELAGDINLRMAWGIALMFWSITGFLSVFTGNSSIDEASAAGGVSGFLLYPFLLGPMGLGAILILLIILLVGFFLFSQLTFVEFIENFRKAFKNPSRIWDLIPDVLEVWQGKSTKDPSSPYFIEKVENLGEAMKIKKSKNPNPSKHNLNPKPTPNLPTQNHKIPLASKRELQWELPNWELLNPVKSKSEPGDIEANKELIEETLANFGIQVEMDYTVTGPTVTQYTFKPASGIKLSSIDSVQRDLALALAVNSLRIESPVGGRSLVGVEIPNQTKSPVGLRDVLQSSDFINFEAPIPVSIGQDVAGNNMVFSLAKMPHLLVAGATGSGKSIWINAMLLSLLYRYSPEDLELVLVDMKRVELKLYENIPHLLSSVITEPEAAINALKWSLLEMDRRYKLLEEHGKRNIEDYNKLVQEDPSLELEKLPYQIFVIDELGDLMMLAKSEVEPMIVRLTQMSRAVGIHLVIGTQRPDTGVVTGLIKANIPSRIAFAVASQIDSRVILDNSGAEKLLGQGDGLFLSSQNPRPIRFQGPLVTEPEIRKIVRFLREQTLNLEIKGNHNPNVTEPPNTNLSFPGMQKTKSSNTKNDETYLETKKIIAQYQKASTSFIQQMLGIGYPKAAKMMQYLEDDGYVGPPNGSKPREVYLTLEDIAQEEG